MFFGLFQCVLAGSVYFLAHSRIFFVGFVVLWLVPVAFWLVSWSFSQFISFFGSVYSCCSQFLFIYFFWPVSVFLAGSKEFLSVQCCCRWC